jgi:hypothetical protein
VLLFQTQCTSRELIEYILQDLGVDVKGMGLVAMHGKLNEILFEELLAGKRFVLVVDEAQNLDDTVLETVRMLCNFETHNAKLMQIVLAGQPRLASKLAQPRLSQLRQRIAVLSHLEPFTVKETGHYIEHRLKVAGHNGEAIFGPVALSMIARLSDGIPRNINNICYNSLLLSYTRGLRKVTAEIVQETVNRLDLELLISEPPAIPAPPETIPVASAVAAAAKVPEPEPVPVTATVPKLADPVMPAMLTYNPGKKITLPGWHMRSAILAVIVLFATLLIAIMGRSESMRGMAPAILKHFSNVQGAPLPSGGSAGTTANYDAAPQDTESGQVITVMAGSHQSLKDLTLRYVGHFDSELAKEIFSLNPNLKDPDHLEAGQLIRIPLPHGAMKKAKDTAEDFSPSKPETSGNFFHRFTALLGAPK